MAAAPENDSSKHLKSLEKMQVDAEELGCIQCINELRRTMYATPAGWALVVFLVHNIVPWRDVLIWLGIFVLGWCINLCMLRYAPKEPSRKVQRKFWLSATAVLDGFCWGLIVLLLMTHDHRLDAWLVIVLCGIVSVNLPTYITYPRAFRVLATSIWLTAVASAAIHGSRLDAAPQLVFALMAYVVALIYTIRPISTRVIEGIRLHLENAALTEDLRQSLDHVKHQASTDSLTGQLNRRALDQELDRLITEGNKQGFVFSLLILDIDFFKRINDTHGHDIGDQALRSAAQRISSQLRQGDLSARFGGEEFVVLLPAADLRLACNVAERIRVAFTEAPLATEPPLAVTVSIGVATHKAGMTAETLLKEADREVYIAKNNGRNQVRPAKIHE